VPYLLTVQNESLAEIYSSKSDEELIVLAADADALVDEARSVLAEELLRRNINVEPSATERSTPQTNSMVVKRLRLIGAFLSNLAIAVLGTTIVESSMLALSKIIRVHTVSGMEVRQLSLSLTIAALLGFFIGRRRPTTAIWIWTLPIAFFGLGALLYIARPNTGVLAEGGFAQHFFVPDLDDRRDFFLFTIPATRAAAYSLAAWLSVHFRSPTF
jgi:hypothetical protein